MVNIKKCESNHFMYSYKFLFFSNSETCLKNFLLFWWGKWTKSFYLYPFVLSQVEDFWKITKKHAIQLKRRKAPWDPFLCSSFSIYTRWFAFVCFSSSFFLEFILYGIQNTKITRMKIYTFNIKYVLFIIQVFFYRFCNEIISHWFLTNSII